MPRFKKLLYEDEALIGNIKTATEFRYVKLLRLYLKFINGWPAKEIGENYSECRSLGFSVIQITLNVFCLSTCLIYIWLHSDIPFFELVHIIITVMMGFVSFTRIIMTLPQCTKYRNLVSKFLTKTHLFFYKDISEYAMKTFSKINFMSHLFTLYLTIQVICGITLFNTIPMWSNYSSGKYKEKNLYNSTYVHSLYLSVPILKIHTQFGAYVVSCLYNWLMSCLCSVSFCALDLLLSLMVFNIWGHFKILLHELQTFPLPANNVVLTMDNRDATVNAEMYSEEEQKIISEKLKWCIDYHRLIKDFTDSISAAFGPMLFVYLAFHQVSGCLLLLVCSQMTAEALMRYLCLAVILFQQLIQLSVIFELVGSTSEKLKDAVYGVPWEFMNTDNRKIVSIFLFNVQEPIHVKALGVVNVGVATMASILKTSLSYFTFLRSV